jgi:hypothetical protein
VSNTIENPNFEDDLPSGVDPQLPVTTQEVQDGPFITLEQEAEIDDLVQNKAFTYGMARTYVLGPKVVATNANTDNTTEKSRESEQSLGNQRRRSSRKTRPLSISELRGADRGPEHVIRDVLRHQGYYD